MMLKLSLSPEAEERLRERARAAGVSPEEFARRAVEASLGTQGRDGTGQENRRPGTVAELFGPGDLAPEEAERRRRHLEAWFEKALPGTPGEVADDSRESIYAGRGE